jgi:hypothetical protein
MRGGLFWGLTLVIPGGGAVRAVGWLGRALGLTRAAQAVRPAATVSALAQRFTFAQSALSTLRQGGGTVIAGVGARRPTVFRDAGRYAQRYGGNARDYIKVSVTRRTASGERVSVHAVRDVVRNRLHDPKLILDR